MAKRTVDREQLQQSIKDMMGFDDKTINMFIKMVESGTPWAFDNGGTTKNVVTKKGDKFTLESIFAELLY